MNHSVHLFLSSFHSNEDQVPYLLEASLAAFLVSDVGTYSFPAVRAKILAIVLDSLPSPIYHNLFMKNKVQNTYRV